MRRIGSIVCAICLAALLFPGSSLAASGGSRHLNFAAFEKVDPGFEFDDIVTGKFSDFIEAMKGSQVLLISHTADAINGDVFNIQQDVLRAEGNKLGDEGINCQLSFVDKSTKDNTDYSVGGLCKIIEVGNGKNVRLKAVIPMAGLPDTAQGVDAWVKLYEDEKTGIAFYANVSH